MPDQSAGCPEVPDALTDALLFLAAFHGRALSRKALLTGLPITDGMLSVHLFERAANRAGAYPSGEYRGVTEACSVRVFKEDGAIRRTLACQSRR